MISSTVFQRASALLVTSCLAGVLSCSIKLRRTSRAVMEEYVITCQTVKNAIDYRKYEARSRALLQRGIAGQCCDTLIGKLQPVLRPHHEGFFGADQPTECCVKASSKGFVCKERHIVSYAVECLPYQLALRVRTNLEKK
eukprot:3563371-Amphidinium_carterae.1